MPNTPNLKIGNYPVGTTLWFSFYLKDRQGTPSDPDTLLLTLKSPTVGAALVTFDINDMTKVAVGSYYVDYAPNAVGTWHWRVASTGNPTLVDQGYITIVASNVG